MSGVNNAGSIPLVPLNSNQILSIQGTKNVTTLGIPQTEVALTGKDGHQYVEFYDPDTHKFMGRFKDATLDDSGNIVNNKGGSILTDTEQYNKISNTLQQLQTQQQSPGYIPPMIRALANFSPLLQLFAMLRSLSGAGGSSQPSGQSPMQNQSVTS